MVITSKHHDGFALFDSKGSRYNVVAATPFHRDILKELAAACQKRGMPLGFYYSQSQDWHEPGGAGNDWDFGPDQGPDKKELKDYDGYLRGKAEPQVRELLTNYGPVALIWFDTRGQPLALRHNEWRVTTRPGKLYFTFFHERVPFELPAMKNAIKRALNAWLTGRA